VSIFISAGGGRCSSREERIPKKIGAVTHCEGAGGEHRRSRPKDRQRNADYWSSSEYNNNNAWNQNFGSGNQNNNNKNNANYVRCVRS
jgi:hypothetical protein